MKYPGRNHRVEPRLDVLVKLWAGEDDLSEAEVEFLGGPEGVASAKALYGTMHSGLSMLKDIVGVQPMSAPTGQVFHLRYQL